MANTPPSDDLLRIQVTGRSPDLWLRFRTKFIEAIDGLLDSVVDHDKGTTLREESRKFQSALLDLARARLARAGLENERIEAEIRKLYAQMENETAQARRVNAEADAIEFKTSLARLRLVLGAAKAMLMGEEGEESIILAKRLDAMLTEARRIEVTD